MIVVDAHQDIAYNSLCYLRDYRQSAWLHRRREADLGYPLATLGLPDAILGRVALVFATLFAEPKGVALHSTPVPGREPLYTTPQEAYREAMIHFDYYQRLSDEHPQVRLIRTQSDLEAVLGTWSQDNLAKRQQGLVVLMEGADPILEPRQFEEWYERGVRVVGLAWQRTRYSGGTSHPGGLTPLGRDLLEVLASYHVLLDLSHAAEAAFLESLDRYEGHIIASHSNPRKFRDTDRHLTDEMIRRLAERDGVMGVVLYNRFLKPDWQSGDHKRDVPMERVLDVIDYVCQLTGSAAHVGIGSDFDGGFGAESIPDGMETVTDLWNLHYMLQERGYSTEDIEAILGGNMLRKLRACLPK